MQCLTLDIHRHHLFQSYFGFYFGFSIDKFIDKLSGGALGVLSTPEDLDAGSEVGIDAHTGDIESELENEKTIFPLLHEIKYKVKFGSLWNF